MNCNTSHKWIINKLNILLKMLNVDCDKKLNKKSYLYDFSCYDCDTRIDCLYIKSFFEGVVLENF